jgi:hypothetical protein
LKQKKPPLGLKNIYFDHEIMEIGLICSNLVGKTHRSSTPGHISRNNEMKKYSLLTSPEE